MGDSLVSYLVRCAMNIVVNYVVLSLLAGASILAQNPLHNRGTPKLLTLGVVGIVLLNLQVKYYYNDLVGPSYPPVASFMQGTSAQTAFFVARAAAQFVTHFSPLLHLV